MACRKPIAQLNGENNYKSKNNLKSYQLYFISVTNILFRLRHRIVRLFSVHNLIYKNNFITLLLLFYTIILFFRTLFLVTP